MNELMNELINCEAVYRTAPATPGLLKMGGCRSLGGDFGVFSHHLTMILT